MTRPHLFLIPLFTVFMTGCKEINKHAGSSNSERTATKPKAKDPLTDENNISGSWLGKWIGPEGTYLVLSGGPTKYTVEIHSLDGPAVYRGFPVGDHIEFTRHGKTESIRSGDGHDTGMKWLLDKQHCLVIRLGEGFCRD